MLQGQRSPKERRAALYYGLISRIAPGFAAWQAVRVFASPIRHATPEREIEYAKGARQFLDSHGIFTSIWTAETALSHAGTVLLLHGWSGRGTQLGAFAKPLVQAGFRVIAVDGPAHGQSKGVRTNPREFYEMLFRLEKEHGPFHAIIAHSFGAGCSTWALSEGLQSKRFVFVSSAANFDDIVDRFCRILNLSSRARDEFFARIRKGISREKPLDVAEMLGTLKQPVLVVHDLEDREISYDIVARLKARAPDIRVMTTKGLGHHRILRDPEVVRAVVDFISG